MKKIKKILIPFLISSSIFCSLVLSSCYSTNPPNVLPPSETSKNEIEDFINKLNIKLAPTELGRDTLPSSINDLKTISNYVSGIPQNQNGFIIEIKEIKNHDNNKGLLTIVIEFKKDNLLPKIKEFDVSGFKTIQMQDQEDVNNLANSPLNLVPTELGAKTSPSSILNINSISDYISGIPTTQNGVNVEIHSIKNQNDAQGTLVLSLRFWKGTTSVIKEYLVSGFSTNSSQNPLPPPQQPDEVYEQMLNEEVKRFIVTLKPNKVIDQLYASSLVNNEQKFKEYFEWEEKPSFSYNFELRADDAKGELKVNTRITVLDNESNPVFDDEKIFGPFTGFAKKTNIQEENRKTLQKALEALTITKKTDISNITTNEYLENKYDNFRKYFQINKDEVERLGINISVHPQPTNSVVKRGEFESIIFTQKVSVGLGKDQVSGEKQIKISGFKKLLSDLDSATPVNLPTPTNAKSYKGLIQPLPKLQKSSSENYARSLQSFNWEQYKVEMIYQVRFYMYQIFQDNFSELNYYTIGGENEGDTFDTVAEGILKTDMLNLYGYLQNYGGTVSFRKSFKAGQKIKLVISQVKENQDGWMPSAAIVSNFSFANSCSNIDTTKNLTWMSLMSKDRNFRWNLSLDGVKFASESEKWNMRTYMFTIARKI